MSGGTNETAKKRRHPLARLLTGLFMLLLLVIIAAILFPAPILRYVFSRVEAQSGIVLTFDRAYFYIADGSFLSFDGLTIKRQNHHVSNFDMKAKRVRMPAMLPNDFRLPILVVEGLSGTYEIVGSDPADTMDTSVYVLMLVDSEVDFIDRTLDEPFRATIQIKEFTATNTKRPSLLEPYTCTGHGQIGDAPFALKYETNGTGIIEMFEVPLTLFAPYAPVLDDIFDAGSVNIRVDDLTDAAQKKLHVSIRLLPDCEIKSADKILAPAIQAALQQLDQTSVPALHDLRGNIERLKTALDPLRAQLDDAVKMDDAVKIMDAFRVLPPTVREEYDKMKSRYDQKTAEYEKWSTQYETLVRDIDRIKLNILEETFQHFIDTGVPIEIDLREVDGAWQYDSYNAAVRLLEQTYRTIIANEFQKRIQEMQGAVGRALLP